MASALKHWTHKYAASVSTGIFPEKEQTMRFSISVHNASAEMLSMKVSAKLEKNVGIVTSESKAREYNPTKKSLRKRKYKPHCGFMLVQVLG